MSDSIFTRIIKGEVPAYVIYEDKQTIAILDVHPIQPGHTLVIPKQQIEQLWDLDDSLYQAVMATTKKVALKLRAVLGVKRVGVQVVGVDVPHVHVQLIPFNDASKYYAKTDMDAPINHQQLAELVNKLKL